MVLNKNVHKLVQNSLISERNDYEHNLSREMEIMLWKNTKLIFACREECFQESRHKDQLIAPLNPNNSPIPNLFAQERIASWSNNQISCFLRKCYMFGRLILSEETKNDPTSTDSAASPSKSLRIWRKVDSFEKRIDEIGLREVARIPFMLLVIIDVLPDMKLEDQKVLLDQLQAPPDNDPTSEKPKKPTKFKGSNSNLLEELAKLDPDFNIDDYKDLFQPIFLDKFDSDTQDERDALPSKTLKIYPLIERFISKAIESSLKRSDLNIIKDKKESQKSNETEALKSHTDRINGELRSLALELGGYRTNETRSERDIKDRRPLLESTNLIEWNSDRSKPYFCHPLIQEFLIAKKIEEELIQLEAATSTIKEEILLNQNILKHGVYSKLIFEVLCDAIRQKKISPTFLLNLIKLSSPKQKEASTSTPEECELLEDSEEEAAKHKIIKLSTVHKTTHKESPTRIGLRVKEQEISEAEELTNSAFSQSQFAIAAVNAITILKRGRL